jgi:hypothetical protein
MEAYEYNSSPLQIVQMNPIGSNQLRLMWKSQPNDTHTVWSRADPLTGTWMEEANVPSHGAESPWTDTAASEQIKFYRVEMK